MVPTWMIKDLERQRRERDREERPQLHIEPPAPALDERRPPPERPSTIVVIELGRIP